MVFEGSRPETYPNHVGEIDPSVGVLDGGKGAVLPEERPIFLQKTFEGAFSGFSMQHPIRVISG